jgi:hypothetical protein
VADPRNVRICRVPRGHADERAPVVSRQSVTDSDSHALDDLVLLGRVCGVIEILERMEECALKGILLIP